MTCDDLFDLLTGQSRPDNAPAREAMKRHLAHCRSCRRLADAFEPAVELFREASAGEDFTEPSLYEGPWSEEDVEQHERHDRVERQPLVKRPPDVPEWFHVLLGGDLLRLAAAVLIGLTLGALVWGTTDSPLGATTQGGLAISAPGPVAISAPRVTLASLRLTAACLSMEHRPADHAGVPRVRLASDLLTSANYSALNCCTLCHASLGEAPHSRFATAEVVRSCQACHTF